MIDVDETDLTPTHAENLRFGVTRHSGHLGSDSSVHEGVDECISQCVAVSQPHGEDTKPVGIGDPGEVGMVQETGSPANARSRYHQGGL